MLINTFSNNYCKDGAIYVDNIVNIWLISPVYIFLVIHCRINIAIRRINLNCNCITCEIIYEKNFKTYIKFKIFKKSFKIKKIYL